MVACPHFKTSAMGKIPKSAFLKLHHCTKQEIELLRRSVGHAKILQNQLARRIDPEGREEAKAELAALEKLHAMLFNAKGVSIEEGE